MRHRGAMVMRFKGHALARIRADLEASLQIAGWAYGQAFAFAKYGVGPWQGISAAGRRLERPCYLHSGSASEKFAVRLLDLSSDL